MIWLVYEKTILKNFYTSWRRLFWKVCKCIYPKWSFNIFFQNKYVIYLCICIFWKFLNSGSAEKNWCLNFQNGKCPRTSFQICKKKNCIFTSKFYFDKYIGNELFRVSKQVLIVSWTPPPPLCRNPSRNEIFEITCNNF